MGLVARAELIRQLSPPFDALLSSQLVDEFVSMERRYIQRDWEPTELDGGQFCEILGRILYHQDSQNINYNKGFDECISYLENDQVTHHMQPRQGMLHLGRVLRVVYKFRSQRGAVHISANYQANQMDSKLVVESVRWSMNETLRIFWNGDRELVAKAIREILQFDVPCIGTFEDAILVQRTDLDTEEEILVLLHYAGEAGFSRTEIGRYAQKSPPSITRALQNLVSPECRQAIQLGGGNYRLTDLGAKRVREQLASKLLIQ